ncbi:MAG: tripartite tricarboxylate transporter substrate binding protein [Proteobacteria bacterium]|nr:tripartite tricarboxylate transporter substrate binding protein [Pseudomonadota bacterium]
MRYLRALAVALLVVGAGALSAPSSQAADWPSRTVRFIIPLGPGSGVDITARILADKLQTQWGQSVVVENRPGGDAMIAMNAVINANDDHTLLFAPASTFTAHPLLHDKLPYQRDALVPIARVTNTLIALGVPADLGVTSIKELVAKVKAAPGKLNYASVTGANDLLFAAFLKAEKLDMVKVPYKDPVSAINDVSEGRIQAFVGAYAIMRPRVQQGKVKVIALTNVEHAKSLNDIPTAAEAGYKSLELDGLVGVLGTKAVAPDVRKKIAADIRGILDDPAINARLVATGQVVNPGSPDEFAAALKDQTDKVMDIGKILGIKPAQ